MLDSDLAKLYQVETKQLSVEMLLLILLKKWQ
jgi:hypothetical protein